MVANSALLLILKGSCGTYGATTFSIPPNLISPINTLLINIHTVKKDIIALFIPLPLSDNI
jgi:hypothetical protein